MPKIAELREIDGAVWARVEMELGSPIELLSPAEIEVNRKREMARLDEIERLRALLRETLPYIEGAQNTTNMDTGDAAAVLICKIHTAAPMNKGGPK